MNIDIICPLYNAEKYIRNLHKSLEMQKGVTINKYRYIVTKGTDNTEQILQELKIDYELIKPEEFSHALTREKEAMKSNADILVFITQDIIIKDEYWLYNLVKDIEKNECEACYSRQICTNNTIEKYTREKNYPEESFVVTKKDINKLGLRTFFFSDASSAIKKNVFLELKGYDGKKLPINEDMYIAYKLIMNNYRIKYCAESKVIHSHRFTLKQIYKRYYDTGKFFKENSYLDNFKTNKTGGNLALYILKRAIQDKNVNVLINFIPNMSARFLGMKKGKYDGRK